MGSRGSEYERGALILSCALVFLWFLSGHPERNPPSADGGIPRGIVSYTEQTTEKRLFEIKEKSNK